MIPAVDLPRPATSPQRSRGRVVENRSVSAGMLGLVIELDDPAAFQPGQFCMLNLEGPGEMVLSRPLSILDLAGKTLELLYKVVGSGTRTFAALAAGARVVCLGPLGIPFPAGADGANHLVLAGGVGLPPLLAWERAYGGPGDLLCFGGRDGTDVPWNLLDRRWRVSVDSAAGMPGDREAFAGNVVEMARAALDSDDSPRRVLACGPLPLLRAARDLADAAGWECLVSVEERMGCGYGVCRGCVVPLVGGGYLASCNEGPVLDASRIDWSRFGQWAGPPSAGDRRVGGGHR